MWEIAFRPNPLRERMVLTAPEVDPHRFVQRLLSSRKPTPVFPERRSLERTGLYDGKKFAANGV